MNNIMFYISSIGDGGAQRVVANLANYFSKRQYFVSLVTDKPRDNEYYLEPEVKRYYLEEHNTKNKPRIWRNLVWIYRLKKICRLKKTDVLVSFMAEPNYRAVISSLGSKVKTVISVRNDPSFEYSGRIGEILATHLLSKADGCVFQTEDAKKWFPVKLQDKATIIYNQVNPSFFNVEWKPVSGRAVACGRLNKQKNYYFMIDAIKELRNSGEVVHLDIYGDGEEKSKIGEYIRQVGLEDHVSLKGRTNDVSSVLQQASVFLLSSDYEGMPNALMEAISVGVPSVCTDCPCGGPKELLKDGAGIIVSINDLPGFVNAIKKILNDAEYSAHMSGSAKKTAHQFDPSIVGRKWEEYITSIVEAK